MPAGDLEKLDYAFAYRDRLMAAGVDNFKVEGRTKSIYYLAITTRSYRRGIDQRRRRLGAF